MSILIVDDEKLALQSVKRLLSWEGYRDIDTCADGHEAIEKIKNNDFDIVLLDILMPEVDGLQVLKETKPFKPLTEFIMLTAVDDVDTAINAVRMGAYDYLVKPVDNKRLFLSLERSYERKGFFSCRASTAVNNKHKVLPAAFQSIITRNRKMRELLSYTEVMARSGIPVLITGESGTGKELLARGVHHAGPSPAGPFISVNVSSVPETMFESQFFGHVKGAFTGATQDYTGFFEQANGGTLFLDEIGELPLHLQVKFLRILEEKTVVPLGSKKTVHLDIRIVSATNQDLDKACRDGRLRLDLLYRLKGAHVHLPPLRERQDDVALLAEHYLKLACEKHGKSILSLSPNALDILANENFPGNIRELSQLIERAVILCDTSTISPQHLGAENHAAPLSTRTLCSFKEDDERHLAFVLEHTAGDRQQAAQILGVSLRQVHRRLARISKNST